MADPPIDPHTNPKHPGLLGVGLHPVPVGARPHPAPIRARKAAPKPVVITCDLVAQMPNRSASCMVVEDPKARSPTGELILTQKSSSFSSKFFRVTRNGVNHYVSVITKSDPGEVSWDSCNIFHHPSANQHHGGIADSNYDPPTKPWLEIRDSYVFHMGVQHTARSAVPLVVPLIRIGAWAGANGSNYIFGAHAQDTLTLLLRKASGNDTLTVGQISTSSYSNGIQSHAQTLQHFGSGFVAFASDYDSSIAAKGTMNIAPTAAMKVRRYSQHADPATKETTEALLPFKLWPDIDYLNANARKPLIRPAKVTPAKFAEQQMFWTHWRIANACHWHAMG